MVLQVTTKIIIYNHNNASYLKPTISLCLWNFWGPPNTIKNYKVAKILVKPIQPMIKVWPQPQNKAIKGFIG